MADNKMVMKQLQSNFRGDMDLFSQEILPNSTDIQEKLNSKIELYSKCTINYDTGLDGDKFTTLCEIGDSLSGMIEKIHNFHYKQKKLNQTKQLVHAKHICILQVYGYKLKHYS